jgi:hypothetical protein
MSEKAFGIAFVALSLAAILGFACDRSPSADHEVIPMYVSVAAMVPIAIALTFRGAWWAVAMSVVAIGTAIAAHMSDTASLRTGPRRDPWDLLGWLYNAGCALFVSQLIAVPWLIAGVRSYAVSPVWVRRPPMASESPDS